MHRHVTSLIALIVLATSSARLPAKSFVYISLAGENAIAIWSMDEQSGDLEYLSRVEVEGEPGGLTTDPQRKFLFASLRSAGKIASFKLDPETGGLAAISVIEADADPAYIATDHKGRFLLSAYYFAGKIAVHEIGEDGSLDAANGRWQDTEDKAHAIDLDPSNRIALVPHTGPNCVFQFFFDAADGTLRSAHPDRLQMASSTGPRHLAYHPRYRWAYFDQEQGSAVTACRYSTWTAILKPVQTLPSIPADFEGSNSTAHLEIHPSGRFLYAANRGHDSIAIYQVNQLNGRLKSMGQTATEKTPRSFNVDRSGRFLYAAGQGSGKVAAFQVHPLHGTLHRFATYDVGERPWWIKVVRFGK